jgi:hypothetical protein
MTEAEGDNEYAAGDEEGTLAEQGVEMRMWRSPTRRAQGNYDLWQLLIRERRSVDVRAWSM